MLLRIYFDPARSSDIDEEKMVVWRGPRREIWEQGARLFVAAPPSLGIEASNQSLVTIGRYLPRARFLPLGLPNTVKLLLE